MSALISAILRALKGIGSAMLYVLDWTIMLPFRIFAPPQGNSSIEGPPRTGADIRDAADRAAPSDADLVRTRRREATAVVNWCDSYRLHGAAVAPSRGPISHSTAAWLQSLSRREAEMLVEAGYVRAAKHIAGETLIDGVKPLTGDGRIMSSRGRLAEAEAAVRKGRRRSPIEPSAPESPGATLVPTF